MRRLKPFHFLFACTFFFCLGGVLLNFSLVYHLADRFFFTPGQIGTYLALGNLFYFVGTTFYLRIGSKFNPAKIFPVAAGLVFLASIPIGYARTPSILYVFFWILQLSTAFFWPPILAHITSGFVGKELNLRISQFSRSWMAALMLAPILGGVVYRWNSTVNFVIVNLSFFTAILLFVVAKRLFGKNEAPEPPYPVLNTDSKTPEPDLKILDKRLDLYRYRGWMCMFSITMCMGILVNIIPLHIRDGLGFTEQSAGLVLFSRSATGFITFALFAKFTVWHFNRWWFVLIQAGLMFCAFLFLLAGNMLVFFFFVSGLFGVLNSAVNVTSVFYSGATGKNPKKNMAYHEIFMALGMATGSAGGGFIYQHFRFTGLCVALLLMLGLGLTAFIVMGRREEKVPVVLPSEV